jgi:anaerobic selenocysteine-containing dehydrogenase/Fe-S-cluster-containing dehydrogenase component
MWCFKEIRIEERALEKLSRRGFLKLAAGGGAMAADWGTKSTERLIPYVVPPENIRPGVWNYFATTCRECPAGCGMHVWHRDGRVTKVEGNPEHPINRGGLCARGQSAVQGLYDPDRIRQPLFRPKGGKAEPVTWEKAVGEIGQALRRAGDHVALLSDLQAGTLVPLLCRLQVDTGAPRRLLYEPLAYEALRAAHEVVFGLPGIPDYRIDRCDFLISFAADFIETWVSPVQYARRFAEMRSVRDGRMGRFVYVGPRLSATAANADLFIQVPPGAERDVALAMLRAMVRNGWVLGDAAGLKQILESTQAGVGAANVSAEKIEELARSFVKSGGSAALAGPTGAAGRGAFETAVAAGLLNGAAGRLGQTVDFSRPHALSAAATEEQVVRFLADLGPQDILVIHQANILHSRPRAFDDIRRAAVVVYLGTMMDETAEAADWVLPIDSPLESWGDYSPTPEVVGLLQPTMGRLFDTRGAGEVAIDLCRAAGKSVPGPDKDYPNRLRSFFMPSLLPGVVPQNAPRDVVQAAWQMTLQQGGLWPASAESRLKAGPTPPNAPFPVAGKALNFSTPRAAAGTDAADLWVWPHVFLFDGRGANRGWLQEAPDPTTHITWGCWVDVHPAQAKALGLADGDVVELAAAGAGKVEAPVRVTEDVCEGTVAIPLGQGHTALGRNAAGRGANAFALLGGETARGAAGGGTFGRVTIKKTGRREEIARASSGEQGQHGRKIVQWTTPAEMQKPQPGAPDHFVLPLPEGYTIGKDLYPPHEHKEHRWAMVVDLARCTGCGACAVACYAENNVPVIGPEHNRRGRHMGWLQVVPYRDPADPRRMGFLPLMCQHCDAAPCEPVCPVFAAVHSDEGLNSQVYNRCIGTRYCSNNCPYKVRRFNWINVDWQKPLTLQLNPEVTVRVRGVMEKCTFCIQRIRQVEHLAKREGRPVRDGEAPPACAQSCPTRAITFGDLMDARAEVTRLTRTDPRRYHVLGELNTKPGVAYLKRIRVDVINNV